MSEDSQPLDKPPERGNHLSPKWMRDIGQLLSIRSQFILSGNVRDDVVFESAGGSKILSLNRAITDILLELGYKAVLVWDQVDGMQVLHCGESESNQLSQLLQLPDLSSQNVTLDEVGNVLRRVANPDAQHSLSCALIIDFTSRIPEEGQYVGQVKSLYVKAEKAAREAVPLGLNVEGEERYLFNPIFWILNRQGDVPFWFSLDNERIHALSITAPDADTRKRVFKALYPLLPAASQDVSDEEFSTIASGLSHGMPVTALRDIVTLTGQRALKASDVDDAVQCYRVGDLNMDNPWRGKTLHKEISNGTSTLEGRVKGQDNAVSKVLDVLKRTALGLTGAQAGSASTRPRGVLFFVGPTGVGKTELAKSITQLVFGDESAYIRFDMSEFSAEHSADRLIGAPPGYTGFDQGGELTNAMKENPFRVVLFDEIEKAHRLILDKFLQILEDGRLTDGRGETVSFSDALIIFTSNKGVSRTDEEGRVHYLVSPNDSRSELEDKIMGGIESYFHNELGRPELLNRFGENFVIFNFISPEVAQIILQVMLGRVKKRLQDECALELVISDKASNTLSDICTTDLMNGARGIGAKLEDALVNPLARVVFDLELGNNSSAIQINEIAKNEKGIYYLDVENSD